MKVFIIEDEIPAQENLKRQLKKHFSDMAIMGTCTSVSDAVDWLRQPRNRPDVIFMDVELSDGLSFEIFEQVKVKSKVIVTTAYDNYAIRAFKVNSIDYLLKPIDDEELVMAVNKCREGEKSTEMDNQRFHSLLAMTTNQEPLPVREFKQRFVVKLGDHIVVLPVVDIAYFISKEKTTYVVMKDSKSYILDMSLDTIEDMLDPKCFFRISRRIITSLTAIADVMRHFSGRLRIGLTPAVSEVTSLNEELDELFVSRVRTSDFMRWLNG